MNIYDSLTNDFDNNGYGFLKDCLNAKVIETLNGDMTLEFDYLTNGYLNEYLVQDNIVKCNVGNDNYQLFRIKRVKKGFETMNIYALHIFYDLLDNMVEDSAPTNLGCQDFGNWILNHTNFNNSFTFQSNISGTKSARYVRRNPVECIIANLSNSMLNIFGGYLERDNFTIKLNSTRGSNHNLKLIVGKNIKSIQVTTDITSMYTRILPLGFDGLKLPELYVDSQYINNYPTPKIAKVEFNNIKYDSDDENAYHTEEEAYQALRDSVNALYQAGIDLPSINVKIDWLELSKTKEYEQYKFLETVHLGDTIQAELLGLDYETKVITTTYNPLTDTIEKYEVGTFSTTIGNSINANTQKIESIDVKSILDKATNDATNLISSAMGGYVYKTQSELFIMDTDNLSTAQKVWRWNLNGLGYSSTGVNGTFNTAMTQDGQIVADFITTGTLSTERISGLDEVIVSIENKLDNVSTNIDKDGNVTEVTTTSGFTFNAFGLHIVGNDFEAQHTPTGTYYKDGVSVVGQYTKDGSKQKDLELFGTYSYGKNNINDTPMFVAQLYKDENGEECFGHFCNRGD